MSSYRLDNAKIWLSCFVKQLTPYWTGQLKSERLTSELTAGTNTPFQFEFYILKFFYHWRRHQRGHTNMVQQEQGSLQRQQTLSAVPKFFDI